MFVPFCTHPANQSVDSSFLILASQHTSCSGCWWILHTTCPRHWDQRPVRCSVFLAISPCQLHCLHQRCTENQEGSSVGLFTSIFLAGSSVDCWLFFCDAVIKPKHSHFHTCVCSNEARISSILSCKGLLALAVGFAKLLPLGVAHSSPGNILRSQINPFFSRPSQWPVKSPFSNALFFESREQKHWEQVWNQLPPGDCAAPHEQHLKVGKRTTWRFPFWQVSRPLAKIAPEKSHVMVILFIYSTSR